MYGVGDGGDGQASEQRSETFNSPTLELPYLVGDLSGVLCGVMWSCSGRVFQPPRSPSNPSRYISEILPTKVGYTTKDLKKPWFTFIFTFISMSCWMWQVYTAYPILRQIHLRTWVACMQRRAVWKSKRQNLGLVLLPWQQSAGNPSNEFKIVLSGSNSGNPCEKCEKGFWP